MDRHGISAAEVVQVIANRHITAPNRRREPGGMLLIGETDGGRVLTIAIAPTDDPTSWRPTDNGARGLTAPTDGLPPSSPIGIMEVMKAEEFDPIDEREVAIHDGDPTELVVSVRLDAEESRLLTGLAEADGADPPTTLRPALHQRAAARSQQTSR